MRAVLALALLSAAMGCVPMAARDAGSPAEESAAGGSGDREEQGAPAQPKMLVHRGALFGRHEIRYRVGRATAWRVRYRLRRALYLPGRTPFVESYDAVFRIERRGVTPEGSLRFAFELIEGTSADGRGRHGPLATFAGLKMTTAIADNGSWMESRWEIPPETPPKALRAAEFLQPRFAFAFPRIALGSGAHWTNEFLGTTTNLKTAKQMKQTMRIVDLDDDQVRFDIDEEMTEQATKISLGGSGPVDFEGGPSVGHGTVTVRLDRLVTETRATLQRRSRSGDAFALFQSDEEISTIADAVP